MNTQALTVPLEFLAKWLGDVRDVPNVTAVPVGEFCDCASTRCALVLCGSSSLWTVRTAARWIVGGQNRVIVVTGGIGHSTRYLIEALFEESFSTTREAVFRETPPLPSLSSTLSRRFAQRHPHLHRVVVGMMGDERYCDRLAPILDRLNLYLQQEAGEVTETRRDGETSVTDIFSSLGLSEAEWIGGLLQYVWCIPRDQILLETKSTNCGANARESLRVIVDEGYRQEMPLRIMVLQDPTMQRRTILSFVKEMKEVLRGKDVELCTPYCHPVSEQLALGVAIPDAFWYSEERLVSLVIGEWERLRNDERGYGPNGKGYIAACHIPDEVETAFASVAQSFQVHQRPAV